MQFEKQQAFAKKNENKRRRQESSNVKCQWACSNKKKFKQMNEQFDSKENKV